MGNRLLHMSSGDTLGLAALLGPYASKYNLAEPDKTELVEETFLMLTTKPQILFEKTVEAAVAEAMDLVFATMLGRKSVDTPPGFLDNQVSAS